MTRHADISVMQHSAELTPMWVNAGGMTPADRPQSRPGLLAQIKSRWTGLMQRRHLRQSTARLAELSFHLLDDAGLAEPGQIDPVKSAPASRQSRTEAKAIHQFARNSIR